MSAAYRVRALLICDLVRREVTGKDIIIGVYHSAILVKSFPRLLRLTFWANIEPLKQGAHSISLRGMLGNEKEPTFEMGAEMEVEVLGRTAPLAFGPVPIEVREPGKMRIQHKQPSGRWETISTLSVDLHPADETTASEQSA